MPQSDPKLFLSSPELTSYVRAQIPYALTAAAPNLRIVDTKLDSNLLGYVAPKLASDTIFLNSRLTDVRVNKGHTNSVMHEYEHILQADVDKRYPQGYDSTIVEMAAAKGITRFDLINQLQKVGRSTKLQEYLKGAPYYTQSAAYFGGMDGQYSLKESFAELSSLETVLNKDLTKDPVVRKEFFGDSQGLIDVYKASTGLRTNRLDAKDLPPMTTQDITKTATSKSYLDSLLGIIKDVKK